MSYIIPRPPLWDRTIDCGWVELTSGGEPIRGYLARPKNASGPRPGLVLLHENIGVIEHRQDYTRRLAHEGFVALTVDLFSRIGGQPPRGAATPDERRAQAFLASADEQTIPDSEAAVDHLLCLEGVDRARIGAIGHCSGGGTLLAWLCGQATRVKAAIAAYPGITVPGPWRPDGKELSRLGAISRLSCPLQIHFGTEDMAVPRPQRDELREALQAVRPATEFHDYPGANHAFQDDTHPNFDAAAAELSWERSLTFLNRYL